LTNSRGDADHRRAFSHANGVRSNRWKQAVSQIAQLSNSAAHAFIWRRVTCFGSSTIVASIRASYHPLFHSSAASAWSLPRRFDSCSRAPTGIPNARSEGMP
jgi:hypothetical protein